MTFLKADDPSYRETYEFAESRHTISATRDGEALFGSPTPDPHSTRSGNLPSR